MKYAGLLFVLFLFRCSSDQWDVEKATEKIFAPDEQQFRKFEIGMSRAGFDAAYTGDAIYGNEMEVIDSVMIGEGVYCETAFRFKENQLTEIAVQLIIDDENKKNALFEAMVNKLNEDLGKGIRDNAQYYWRSESGIVTTDIFLTDYSSGPGNSAANRFVISLYYTAGTAIS